MMLSPNYESFIGSIVACSQWCCCKHMHTCGMQHLYCVVQVSCLKCKAAVGLQLPVQHECAMSTATASRKLEEVLTEAGMLTCPKCNTSIVKDGGCNHMICSKCRTHLCLLCCKVLADAESNEDVYRHFMAAGSQCWTFDDRSKGQTEHAAMQRRQISAANAFLATLDVDMALGVIQNSSLVKDFPAGSFFIGVPQGTTH